MWISHKHKYVFVQLPRTGSTAIGQELRDFYDGTKILHKHARYEDFLKIANPEEKKYFVFSCIRNPMDDVVSIYTKYKTDPREWYTDPEKIQRFNPLERYTNKKLYEFIQNNNADFSDFFLKFYRIPYNNWSELSHHKFDFIIRFENIQNDFAKALELIGIEQIRPLPLKNKTPGREKKFLTYYNTPVVIKRAKHVFGPFMKKWGYEFPPEWEDYNVSWLQQTEFKFYNLPRRLYWRYMK